MIESSSLSTRCCCNCRFVRSRSATRRCVGCWWSPMVTICSVWPRWCCCCGIVLVVVDDVVEFFEVVHAAKDVDWGGTRATTAWTLIPLLFGWYCELTLVPLLTMALFVVLDGFSCCWLGCWCAWWEEVVNWWALARIDDEATTDLKTLSFSGRVDCRWVPFDCCCSCWWLCWCWTLFDNGLRVVVFTDVDVGSFSSAVAPNDLTTIRYGLRCVVDDVSLPKGILHYDTRHTHKSTNQTKKT